MPRLLFVYQFYISKIGAISIKIKSNIFHLIYLEGDAMSNNNLSILLKEYEKKRMHAELDLEKRKEKLYLSIPRLAEIEKKLQTNSISIAKAILQNPKSSVSSLNELTEKLKKERKTILEEHHISESYLQPVYECNKCKDTGYVSDLKHPASMCHCLKQKLLDISYNKSNMSNLEKENFSCFEENKFSEEVDFAKYGTNISPRQNILQIKNSCINFVNNFDDVNQKNLLFTGNTGLR